MGGGRLGCKNELEFVPALEAFFIWWGKESSETPSEKSSGAEIKPASQALVVLSPSLCPM